MNDKKFIRINELATYLNISKVTLWRWRKEGRLPAACAISPRVVGWKRETIESWLDEQANNQSY
ncbi:transcriptional regulator [Vibrio parahaemolyticus]|uniref:helix-turn-helix transcriptional regulator n=1 Tax=Vibrio harveyi group TaxID=717610 RepID=UPI0011238CBB|nr:MULTISPECIES: helix-turn-helix domain-containing protein [Vibrio harveyi group]EKP4406572.1 helix-turn-helix domain-containing protein [Vibrio parahaemolyticus]MCR9311855.1 helix-turn-helix domain-containing protein [Vibrio alginolyticus]MCR9319512.1 helix-turn-helix domain-containing protein [Vibrio alginolyticus]MCR9402269.1 helix-turn-helix domain-containing protein [Vibrio alginolyticus]MCR9468451.1 helix-turn-helix domain-containing protein [Vibrio alginolyticus]